MRAVVTIARRRMTNGGMSVTPAELKRRFEEFLATLSKGKDASKISILLDT